MADDSLRSKSIVKALYLLAEGEIVGLSSSEDAVEKLKNVFFDETAVAAANGTYNRQGVKIFETKGVPWASDSSSIPFSEIETEIRRDTVVSDEAPNIFTITNEEVHGVRLKIKLNALYRINNAGALEKTTLEFKIETRRIGASSWSLVGGANKVINGKTSSAYEESYYIRNPWYPGTGEFDIRVSRITPLSTDAKLRNELRIDSYTTVVAARLAYSDSAMAGLTIDTQELDDSVGNIRFLVKGKKIKLPTGYNPRMDNLDSAPAYPEIWDGTFKSAKEYSTNPAWIFYDILTDKRYGLATLSWRSILTRLSCTKSPSTATSWFRTATVEWRGGLLATW